MIKFVSGYIRSTIVKSNYYFYDIRKISRIISERFLIPYGKCTFGKSFFRA